MSTSTKPKHDPRAEFVGVLDSDLLNALSKLDQAHRDLDRALSRAAIRENIAADIEPMRKKAADMLRGNAMEGLRSARTSHPGTAAWNKVEEMVTAYVLASPAFTEMIVNVLGGDLPTDADLAAQRDEMEQVKQRIAAIKAELAARSEDADRAYRERAFASRSLQPLT
jgi:hypothetical protein